MRVSNAKVHTSEFKCTKKHLKNACLSEPENEITEKHTGPAELVGLIEVKVAVALQLDNI